MARRGRSARRLHPARGGSRRRREHELAMSGASLADTLDRALAQAREGGATLNESLSLSAATVRARNPAAADAVDRLVARLRGAEAGKDAPGPGEAMPEFVLPDENG